MSDKLAWGIMGTGKIAGIFARGLARSQTGYLRAVGSRTREAESNRQRLRESVMGRSGQCRGPAVRINAVLRLRNARLVGKAVGAMKLP